MNYDLLHLLGIVGPGYKLPSRMATREEAVDGSIRVIVEQGNAPDSDVQMLIDATDLIQALSGAPPVEYRIIKRDKEQ